MTLPPSSPRERVGAHLNLISLRPRLSSAFVVEHRACARRGPNALPFPAGVGIVDAAIHVLAEEAHRKAALGTQIPGAEGSVVNCWREVLLFLGPGESGFQ
jgi:hypothetical protein